MAEVNWFFARGAVQSGPFGTSQLRELAHSGRIAPDDLVWRDGLADWVPASRVKGLFPDTKPAAQQPLADTPPALDEVAPVVTEEASSVVVAAPASAVETAAAQPRESFSHSKAPLGTVILAVQAGLWGLCVLVLLVSGISLLVSLLSGENAAERSASATVFCTLLVGAYVLARTGEKVAGLVERYVARQDGTTPPSGDESPPPTA